MDARYLLLAYTLLTHSLTTSMWWAAGSWMGLSRNASKHWMLSSLCYGLGLLLTILNPHGENSLPWLLASVLVVLGAVSLRRGMQSFLRLPRTDVAHLVASLGTLVLCLVVCLPLAWRQVGLVAACMVMCWVLTQIALECFQPIRLEFKAGTAWAHTALMGMAVAVFASAAASLTLPQWHWPWLLLDTLEMQSMLVVASLAMSILSSFVLGYIVVLRLVRRLEHLSHHDGLTGLLNRRAIEALLDRESQRLQRFNEPFAVLMVDIDHFKRINDRLGHAAGDAVLAAVGTTLQAQAREVDRIARYGGEEFCMLLPHTLHEGAWQAAERLREAIAQINIAWGDESVSVTISTGLACATVNTETLPSLLRRADEALYAAKAAGRNRVVSAPAHPPAAPA